MKHQRLVRITFSCSVWVPGEGRTMLRGRRRRIQVYSWGLTLIMQVQKHCSQRCLKHTNTPITEIKESGHTCTSKHVHIWAISRNNIVYIHMSCIHRCAQLTHTDSNTRTHRDTQACGNRRRISEAMQIPRCAGKQGEDEEERIGRRSGVPGRTGGGVWYREGGRGTAGCLLLFKRQWVLCAD